MSAASPKRPGAYDHRFHAGNAADVFKHVALVTLLDRLRASAGARLHYVETHAGGGRYHLGPEGEWRDGIGRLLPFVDDDAPILRMLERTLAAEGYQVSAVPDGGFKDEVGRIKRQAARFRLYGLDADSNVVREVTVADAEPNLGQGLGFACHRKVSGISTSKPYKCGP